MKRFWSTIACVLMCLLFQARMSHLRADEFQSFSRQIQPILARKCFACHGPDQEQRQADLRLDDRENAIDMGAIIPHDADTSELMRRIQAEDPDERMPPPDANETLTAAEIQLIGQWIAAGATYEQHWAFVPPQRPRVPIVSRGDGTSSAIARPPQQSPDSSVDVSGWIQNPIDAFVLDHLRRQELQPAPAADRYTIVRRVYLDLIGLPPTPEQADRFVNDGRPDAYTRLVDQLLASPQYGERWARLWLDLAQYSDTNGYEKDRTRSIWPYRDWVVRALNRDMPYDQFSIEQIAGDMLPNATIDQRVATGFHRNTMLNEEGGIDPLEFRFYAMVDRVATTGTVWLGMTTGCAQCHSHKYDPISHTDYYRLFALLNNADEPDLVIPERAVVQQRQELKARIAKLERELPNQFPPRDGDGSLESRRRENFDQHFSDWWKHARDAATSWTTVRPKDWQTNLPRLELLADGSIFSTGDITKRDVFRLRFAIDSADLPITALRLEVLPDDRLPAGGPGRCYYEGRKGDFFLSEVAARFEGASIPFEDASHSYGKISIGSGTADAKNVIDGEGSTGWSTAEQEGQANQLVLNLAEPIRTAGTLELEMLFERHFAASLGRFRWSWTSAAVAPHASALPVDVEALLTLDPATWTDQERARLQDEYCRNVPELAAARKQIDGLRRQIPALPTSMVMQERPADNPRPTFRHHRGEYLSVREEVTPGVPAVFAPLSDNRPPDRLNLAQWLVSDQNPLVARVAVNQAWQAFFGLGLVSSAGDFGTQSDPPTHPHLLDWLACELMDQGWSLKQLHRLIVTSATYQQASSGNRDLWEADPLNRELARGPRYRLDAEIIRDTMLFACKLLSQKMGGPGIYPPQPASVTALAYGETPWNASDGEDRYRRSIYTFSKRTAPFAAYTVFDATSGESCTARRDRSNTPLQALTLLNDAMYLEMSRDLADRLRAIP